jgi:hypothetical protein
LSLIVQPSSRRFAFGPGRVRRRGGQPFVHQRADARLDVGRGAFDGARAPFQRTVARGEVVVVDDRLGVTMTEIIKDGDAS